jgi:hypothetical protein
MKPDQNSEYSLYQLNTDSDLQTMLLTSLGMRRGGEMNPDELAEARVPLLGHQDQLADAPLLPSPLQQVGQPEHRHRDVQV